MMEDTENSNILKIRPVTCGIDPEISYPPISPQKNFQKRPVSIENHTKSILPEIFPEDKFRCKHCRDSTDPCSYCVLQKIVKDKKAAA